MNPKYYYSPFHNGEVCVSETVYWLKNFQNQKSDWVEKSKGFLIILLSYNENEHKYLIFILNGKREDRESVYKFICIRGIYSVCTIIPCFDCIALCIIYNPQNPLPFI